MQHQLRLPSLDDEMFIRPSSLYQSEFPLIAHHLRESTSYKEKHSQLLFLLVQMSKEYIRSIPIAFVIPVASKVQTKCFSLLKSLKTCPLNFQL